MFVTLTALVVGDGLFCGCRAGVSQIIYGLSKETNMSGAPPSPRCAYPFQIRSVWAGLSLCLTAGLRMWITAIPKQAHAADSCQSIRHFSTAPMLQSGTCSTFLPQGETVTDTINTEMDQVSLTWHLSQTPPPLLLHLWGHSEGSKRQQAPFDVVLWGCRSAKNLKY